MSWKCVVAPSICDFVFCLKIGLVSLAHFWRRGWVGIKGWVGVRGVNLFLKCQVPYFYGFYVKVFCLFFEKDDFLERSPNK